jgi:hypothetical protein
MRMDVIVPRRTPSGLPDGGVASVATRIEHAREAHLFQGQGGMRGAVCEAERRYSRGARRVHCGSSRPDGARHRR